VIEFGHLCFLKNNLMIHPLLEALSSANYLHKGIPILVACSGGRDSMTLLHALLQAAFSGIQVAHCNFKLRGQESDEDEAFVMAFCKDHQLPFHRTSFDTNQYAAENGLSIQMAARKLRYEWMETIRKKHQLDLILTAHHADDLAETILFNLVQGTGISGLKGMQPKQGCICRPWLYIPAAVIKDYSDKNLIAYREDSSNASTKYKRNFLRHEIIPQLETLNPNLITEWASFSQRMSDTEVLMMEQVRRIQSKALVPWKNGYRLHVSYTLQHPAAATLIYEFLKKFGCSAGLVAEILDVFRGLKRNNASGQLFASATHRFFLEKNSIYILPIESHRDELISFSGLPHQMIFNEFKIDVRRQPIHEVNVKQDPRYAYFDAALLDFPLVLRYPKTADYFYPLGMSKPGNPSKTGKKKLSKFFKDIKLPLAEREATPVLFSGERLAWVLGQRSDDRFKITAQTKEVICLVITREK
jgi:tRNA(Ile)-lysidine synthase